LALTSGNSDVLFAIQLKRDRRAHAAGLSRCDIPENFAFVCRECSQMTVTQGLKNNVACSGECAAAYASSTLRAPLFLLSDDIPCDEP
jgi:hypothetical protein